MDGFLWCYHSNETYSAYFHMILFIQCVVLTFESVDEILWCYHSNETYSAYFHTILFIQCVVLTFESVDEILWCYHRLMKPLWQYIWIVLFVCYDFRKWNFELFAEFFVGHYEETLFYAEASLCCGETGKKEKERAQESPEPFLFFRLLLFL